MAHSSDRRRAEPLDLEEGSDFGSSMEVDDNAFCKFLRRAEDCTLHQEKKLSFCWEPSFPSLPPQMEVDELDTFFTNGDDSGLQACDKREKAFELLPSPPLRAGLNSQFPELHLTQQTHGLPRVPPDEPVTQTKERFDELNHHLHIPPDTGFGTLSSAGVDAICDQDNRLDQPPQSVFELNGRHAHLLREALGLAQETVDEASSQLLQMEQVLDRNKRIWLILHKVLGQLQRHQLQQQQQQHQHQLQLLQQQQQQLILLQQLQQQQQQHQQEQEQQQQQLQQERQQQQQKQQLLLQQQQLLLQQQQQHQQEQQQQLQQPQQQQQQRQRQRQRQQQRQQKRRGQQQLPHPPACTVPLPSLTASGGAIERMVFDLQQGGGTTTTTSSTTTTTTTTNDASFLAGQDDEHQVLVLHKKKKAKGEIVNALQNVGCSVRYMSKSCQRVGIRSKGLLRVEQSWCQPKVAHSQWSTTLLYNGSRNNNSSSNNNNNNGLIFLPLCKPRLPTQNGLPVHVIKASYEGGVTLVSHRFIRPSRGYLAYICQAWEFSSEWNRQHLIDAIASMTAGLEENQLAKWMGLKAYLEAGTDRTKEEIMDSMNYWHGSEEGKRGTKRKKDEDEEKEKEKEKEEN